MKRSVVSRKRKVRHTIPFARVFLDEQAFISVVVSAIEAYRRECYGVLLGNVRLGRVYIRTAIAYQTARRTPTSVDLAEARRRTLRHVLRAFPRHDYIGEFHSHPGFGGISGSAAIGDSDLVGVRQGECELIIAVRYPRNKMPWHYCADGSLSGVAGEHMVKMRAYMAESMKKGGMRGRPVGLKCNYAVKAASSRRLLEKRKEGPGP
jgi:hypothetical protein